ncbi:AN1-type zinc finger protein 2A isoform X1 [Bufo bufo]|uniref:AN1-type zinc finger protein 2A isoform X1 n=1 Tax=Bufo bufo TaxID=8384 RepID=UPI001ABE1C4F|nr:AN1-type zinc finger protein 2A isoform X1 [Bufo bufo]XP_040297545.1 AN1-type zinc finger protein 2A isoform X1 [Bufo bufo]
MELPDLGKHCSEVTCKQLDFLPMTCDACEDVFCKDHITYDQHKCSSAYKKDVQVPVCPLCGAPVPVKRGELADVAVGQHIDRNCSFEPSKRKQKIFKNRCHKPGCKKKELMKIECDQCHSNFCLSHRHPLDHDCQSKGQALSKAGYAALIRSQKTSEQNRAAIAFPFKAQEAKPPGWCRDIGESSPPVTSAEPVISDFGLHNGLSEEEALQRALELSILEAGINNLLTLRNPTINTIKTGSQ